MTQPKIGEEVLNILLDEYEGAWFLLDEVEPFVLIFNHQIKDDKEKRRWRYITVPELKYIGCKHQKINDDIEIIYPSFKKTRQLVQN